jgi:predicted peptidase
MTRGNSMSRSNLQLVESESLPYLLSVPDAAGRPSAAKPLLCFLHGYDEGAPMQIHRALTLHGPLRPDSSPLATTEFIVVAPQLPMRGDRWYRYADVVEEIVQRLLRSEIS